MVNASTNGYLASPVSGTGSPVLVLHPWWGLNETIKTICNRLAAEGYVAYAPDLYHGQIANTIAEAEALSGELDEASAQVEIAAAADFLSERAGQEQSIAVIGFSLGAYFALELSNAHPESVHTVVVFYGAGPEDFSSSKAAYLGHFAENDPYEPPEYVDALEAALKKAGRPVTFHRYPGTGHWFFEPDRTDAYNESAASLAWARTLEFLQQE